MESDKISAVIILVCVVIFITVLAISNHIKNKRSKFVIENSRLLYEIDKLNKNFNFYMLQNGKYCHKCSGKQEYDKKKFDEIATNFINHNLYQVKEQIDFEKKNQQQKILYEAALKNTIEENRIKQSLFYEQYSFFYEFEEKMIEKMIEEKKREIQTDFHIDIAISYVSPHGRNFYRDTKVYRANEILKLIEKEKEREKVKESVKYERSMMTDSLRYDILKRDNFRCQICGATQEDGVKLHVDHIKPVSKGGKTVKENLRTLCDRCNMGKSAKYDKNGIN